MFHRRLAALVLLAVLPDAQAAGPPRRGADGEPLSAGTIARLGSTRLQDAGNILGLAFSHDGKTLVSVGGSTRFWAVPSGRLLHHVPAPKGSVYRIAFTGDRTFVTASRASLAFWDFPARKATDFWAVPGILLGTSRDGRRLITYTADTITIRGHGPGRAPREISVGKERVESAALSPDGKFLAISGYHRGVDIYDIATGKRRKQLRGLAGRANAVAFAPDGHSLVIACTRGVQVRDADDFVTLRTFCRKDLWCETVALSADGKVMPVPQQDGSIEFWDPTRGKLLSRGTGGHGFLPRSVAVSADGRIAATGGSFESNIALWDVATGKLLFDRRGHRGPVTRLAVSPDGRRLASGGNDRAILLWDLPARKVMHRLYRGPHCIGDLTFSPDGKLLAGSTAQGTQDDRAWLWDTSTGKERCQLGKPRPSIAALAFSPDGRQVLTGSSGLTIQAWDPAGGKSLPNPLTPVPRFTTRLTFSPDGRKLCSLHRQSFAHLFDLTTGKESLLGDHRSEVSSAAFSPDGRLLAVGSMDGVVGLWDVNTVKLLHRCTSYGMGWVHAVAFSPNGRWVVAGGNGPGLHVWEAETGLHQGKYTGQKGAVRALAFTPDGHLISAGDNSAIHIWDFHYLLGWRAIMRAPLGYKALSSSWKDLGGDNLPRAQTAFQALAGAPKQTVHLIDSQLRLPEGMDRIGQFIKDLDSDEFEIREKATESLKRLGPEAAGTLRKALAARPSAEVQRRIHEVLRSFNGSASMTEGVRAVRLVDLLEEIGDGPARKLLARLADGYAGSRVGREAAAALRRLRTRPTATRPAP